MVYDQATNFIRQPLATVQGASIPLPCGGKPRQIMVDIDSQALYARGLSPTDVSNALNAQNLILPAGTAKLRFLLAGQRRAAGAGDVVCAHQRLFERAAGRHRRQSLLPGMYLNVRFKVQNEQIIINPTDDLIESELVQIAEKEQKPSDQPEQSQQQPGRKDEKQGSGKS